MSSKVSVTIVTYNAARHVEECLRSLCCQDYDGPIEITVVDNASSDSTVALLTRWPEARVIESKDNLGFSVAQNMAIAGSTGDWVLCLNPDTRLRPDFVRHLVACGEAVPRAGMICPKILRMNHDGTLPARPVIDSAGVYFTPWLRHHDRGSQQKDMGQYDKPEYVFGYTGAAVLFRREMIEDVSVAGEFMDEDFFLYREDADLAWRAQLLGWRCVYTPFAVAYHVRRVFETNRSSLPADINMHSIKNRFLMRIKNMTPGLYAHVFAPATFRDLAILAYVLMEERTSLRGFRFVLTHWRKTWAKRRSIQARRIATDRELVSWFNYAPTARSLESEVAEAIVRLARSPVAAATKQYGTD